MLGFKSFDAAQGTLVGIELMHMINSNSRRSLNPSIHRDIPFGFS
jgi:transposase-like protein